MPCDNVVQAPESPHINNVGSVLWRLFSTLEAVQYIGGITSVLWGDSFSTVEVVQYMRGIASVHAGG